MNGLFKYACTRAGLPNDAWFQRGTSMPPSVLATLISEPSAKSKPFPRLPRPRPRLPDVVELKRDRTPREVLAQLLDYGSWVAALSADDIEEIYSSRTSNGKNLADAFRDRFGTDRPKRSTRAIA